MSDVTRAEFDALSARVAALEHPGTTPTPTPAPEPQPGAVATLQTPVATTGAGSFTVSAKLTATANATFTYLQIAVRGPGASDLARTPGKKVTKGQSLTLVGRGTGTGDFTAYLAYSLDGTTWVNGPTVAFTVAAPIWKPDTPHTPVTPVTGRKVPLVGRSGLAFNSIVFRQTPADADAFGARRGTPVDGFLWFTSRQKWEHFRAGFDRGYKEWLEAGRLIVTSMPHAPEPEGDEMNQRGADDAYRDQQRALGAFYASLGLNHPNFTIRVDWEANGNWYPWSANRPGGPDALKQAIRNFVTNIRAGGLTQATFDLCWNKGPSQSGADTSFYPGPDIIDVVAVDQYDMWGPAFNDSDWARELAKSPSILSVQNLAAADGNQWAIDECGNTHGGSAMGGDNPFYWDALKRTIVGAAGSCAWHNTYDDRGAPSTLMHDFASNPQAYARYQQLWRP